MIVEVINTTDECPPDCDDAKITVETIKRPFFEKEGARFRVLVDCTHSGVCRYRDDGESDVRHDV